jgi:hypothetical protein
METKFKNTCTKRVFYTRKEAKRALKIINHKKGDRALQDVHYCLMCEAYHLTSMAKQSSRDYTRKIRNQI